MLGLEAPRPCTNGTFQNRTGRKSESDCKACPANHYCPTVATVIPLKCPEASNSQAGAARCTKSVSEARVHVMACICCAHVVLCVYRRPSQGQLHNIGMVFAGQKASGAWNLHRMCPCDLCWSPSVLPHLPPASVQWQQLPRKRIKELP